MRGEHLDPAHHLGPIQPSLAFSCRAASLKPAGTTRYPRPDLSRELDAAWHRAAGLLTCLGTCTGSSPAVLTGRLPRCQGLFSPWDVSLDSPVCESAAGPAPWKRSLPKPASANESPNCRLLRAAPAAARNTGQLLCHNLIAASSLEM